MDECRAVIAGSAPQHEGGAQRSALSSNQELTASIVLRRRPTGADPADLLLAGQFKPESRAEALQQISADPRDVAAVESFARDYGLRVVEADAAKRVVKVSGSVGDFDRAFDIQIGSFGNFISYEGPITVPDGLAGIIIAVLGLDNRPIARARTVQTSQ